MTTPTTTLTFDDLRAQYDDELDELRDAWNELTEHIRDEWGDDALDFNPAQADSLDSEAMERLGAVQATREMYDESGKSIQRRQHALDALADEYGGDEFELRMLTGNELMQIETDLRMEANRRDVDVQLLQSERKGQVVDMATVSAPEGIPTDDEGSPTPSEAPQAIMLALYEQAEQLNNAGTTDFRAPGFGDGDGSGRSSSSVTPTASGPSPRPSDPTDGT
jgi:hypothetical protein